MITCPRLFGSTLIKWAGIGCPSLTSMFTAVNSLPLTFHTWSVGTRSLSKGKIVDLFCINAHLQCGELPADSMISIFLKSVKDCPSVHTPSTFAIRWWGHLSCFYQECFARARRAEHLSLAGEHSSFSYLKQRNSRFDYNIYVYQPKRQTSCKLLFVLFMKLPENRL